MRLRRLTGSLLALLTLHLNLAGADLACTRHGAAEEHAGDDVTPHTRAMPTVASSPMQMHKHVHIASEKAAHTRLATITPSADISAPGVRNEKPPCDVPVQPNCCKALASCNVVFSAGNEFDVASIQNLQQLIAPDAMTAPPSERAAPEPPPPKV